jgi:hypothetical protein
MNLKSKLNKLEQLKRKIAIEADCICFPPNEPPKLLLQAERDAASGVLCPVHGQRFSRFAGPLIYGEVNPLPTHLHLSWQSRSPQYVKAMAASFPSDRWPATKLRSFCAQFVRNFLEDADAGVRLTYSSNRCSTGAVWGIL